MEAMSLKRTVVNRYNCSLAIHPLMSAVFTEFCALRITPFFCFETAPVEPNWVLSMMPLQRLAGLLRDLHHPQLVTRRLVLLNFTSSYRRA